MTRDELLKLESMEKFSLPENEKTWMLERLSELTERFAALNNVDTSGVEPMITVLPLTNVMRSDVAVQTVSRAEVLKNAPEQEDGYFRVPRTLE